METAEMLCQALWQGRAVTVSPEPVTLKSGRVSHVYVSLRHFVCAPENLALLGDVFGEWLGEGRTGLGTAASLLSPVLAGAFAARFGLPLTLFRADGSEKGLAGQVFGRLSGEPVRLVDDVLTSGGTALVAARAFTEQGAGAVSLFVFVDKRPRSKKADFPLPVAAPLTLGELLRFGIETGRLTGGQVALAGTELDFLES
ncbi:phosphoribosyltransferase family protein [Solidesulfovibrio sp.]|uniref:phosphoribosyltransferase family protein n=1 Tax=Solidesulfovibrio sp. TaxID=2910990 RepID=UPI00262E1BFA|nr:phosphoribosyltransferase family protein [Solidesulfovibrio sp.]